MFKKKPEVVDLSEELAEALDVCEAQQAAMTAYHKETTAHNSRICAYLLSTVSLLGGKVFIPDDLLKMAISGETDVDVEPTEDGVNLILVDAEVGE